jgi:CheY-like chemotaxis protein
VAAAFSGGRVPANVEARPMLSIQDLTAESEFPMKKKLRILEVDDEPAICESVVSVLEAPNRTITVAKDGAQALAMTAKKKFDVIIADHRMPRSGGLELVQKLRKRGYTGKIIILSGHLSPENIGVYEDLNVDEVVGKPIDSVELSEIIAGLEDEL